MGIDSVIGIMWERERERDSSSPMSVYYGYGVSHAYTKHTFIHTQGTDYKNSWCSYILRAMTNLLIFVAVFIACSVIVVVVAYTSASAACTVCSCVCFLFFILFFLHLLFC